MHQSVIHLSCNKLCQSLIFWEFMHFRSYQLHCWQWRTETFITLFLKSMFDEYRTLSFLRIKIQVLFFRLMQNLLSNCAITTYARHIYICIPINIVMILHLHEVQLFLSHLVLSHLEKLLQSMCGSEWNGFWKINFEIEDLVLHICNTVI